MNSNNIIAVVFVVLVVLLFVFRNHGKGSTKINSPRVGFLNLKGESGERILAEDRNAIAPMFSAILESTSKPPSCDVLFIYCDLEPDGQIKGVSAKLREIIRDSGAPIVIVASENSGSSYITAAKKSGYGQANLVMTLERKGAFFTTFFVRLFTQMRKGTSMPLAWVKLAPQGGAAHAECPGTIFAAERGQVTFK